MANVISTDPATEYALEVTAGRITAGRPVVLACRRHLQDLEHGADRGLVWNPASAARALDFFPDVLRLNGGEFEGKPFVLEPSQAFIVGSLFGWKRKRADGRRRFRVAFIEIGKGNGKSPLAAGIGLYMMTADGEQRAEVYSAAVDKDQAKVLFRDAVAMVDQSESLGRRIVRSGGRGKEWNLAYLKTGSWFRPIASENQGRGKSGPRPHCGILDEVHEHKTNAMVEFMRAATKGRRQALILLITNSGVERESVCRHYHEYALQVLEGTSDNDAFFAYVCSLDACEQCRAKGAWQPQPGCSDCDDWRDPEVWPKANPLLGVSISRDYLQEQVTEAEGMPSKANLVRRLNFCEWVADEQEWFIAPDIWDRNDSAVSDQDLEGVKCYGGLDLSTKNDLSSLTLVFDTSPRAVRQYAWTPGDTLVERAIRDNAPYERWVEQGKLEATPGETIGYAFVARKIGELLGRFDVRAIGYDPWRMDLLKRELEEEGIAVRLIPVSQGYKGMDPCIEALEDDLREGRLAHGAHPLLTFCVANAVVETGDSGMRKFSKRRARGRIDCAVSLAIANWLLSDPPEIQSWGPADAPVGGAPKTDPAAGGDGFMPMGTW